jgi:SAM-dependent methyltransferase
MTKTKVKTENGANEETGDSSISSDSSPFRCKRTWSETDATPATTGVVSNKRKLDLESDQGHRYGNFRNYYRFHPTNNRTKIMDLPNGILDVISRGWKDCYTKESVAAGSAKSNNDNQCSNMIFRYLDIGCNEGDLTLEVAKLVFTRMQPHATLLVTGVDIDPVLIERAQTKAMSQSNNDNIQIQFQVCDVLAEDFAQQQCMNMTVDLTTVFSTTMWIHIHGGDQGLRRVLRRICQCTKLYIIMEPQSSRSYRDASTRLRRRGGENLDLENLQLRANAEITIREILKENGFEQVDGAADNGGTENDASAFDAKTAWNRSLQLYRRFDSA